MKIFLIRHGESMQNTKENYKLKLPDHKVYLTKKGEDDAEKAGMFLKKYIEENQINLDNSTIFNSPYTRARQTKNIINSYLNIEDQKEDITLIEQRYGLFSDTPLEECKRKYPQNFEYYDKLYKEQGRFYAKLPDGDSPYDVALRMKQFIDTLYRDIYEGKDTFFIVSHGTTIKCFIMDWFHYSPEWYDKEKNLDNCAIRLIDKNENKWQEKYIYKGSVRKRK